MDDIRKLFNSRRVREAAAVITAELTKLLERKNLDSRSSVRSRKPAPSV